MNWFRFYHEALNDPKVQRLPGDLFKAWVNLLCLASQQETRGTLPSVGDCAFALRMDDGQFLEVLDHLMRVGLVDTTGDAVVIHNWHGRQLVKPSDEPERVAARVRKHRETRRNADVTPNVTPLDTDTDTDTDTEERRGETGGVDTPAPTPTHMKRAHRIPADFAVTDDLRAWGHGKALTDAEMDRATERFVNYWQGSGKTKTDWSATWRTWMLRELDEGRLRPASNGNGRTPSSRPSNYEQSMAAIDRVFSKRGAGPSGDIIETTGVIR